MEQEWNQKIAALYRERCDGLYHAAYRILKRQSEAEDAVHTAFVRLLRMKEHYDALTSDELFYMAVCIVRHVALNMLRYEKRHQVCELPETAIEGDAAREMPAVPNRTEDPMQERVRDALYRMPDEDCRLLWMKYYAGMSGEDIAAALHISRHAAEMRLHRARRGLERRMKEDERGEKE